MITPEEAVDKIAERFGRHAGFRAFHAKGTLCTGTFSATPEAARLTRAVHMQGDPVDATVRLSNGAGDPTIPDYAPDVRGHAVKFHLPGDAKADVVSQTAPRFPVRDPDAFMELVMASDRSPAALWKLPWFLARHPGAVASLRVNLPALKPPASYATCTFYAVHAFKWIGPEGETWVRYRWIPEDTAPPPSSEEAKAGGPDYLQKEIADRLGGGPARWTLRLQIAAEGDEVDDPSAQWSDDRDEVDAGTLELTAVREPEKPGEVLVFDPVNVPDGIELSDDPILLFRPHAYSVSVERRLA